MSIIKVTQSGSTKKTESFLDYVKNQKQYEFLSGYAEQGVAALAAATPRDSGLASESWYYDIRITKNGATIVWKNHDETRDGVPVVLMLQYGHGTGTGGYVEGIDFINPATQQVFDNISDAVWKAVQSA